jgi:glycosyltransferase involved in cell wall biosynthesis/tRNA A-37 threonylcarbamoyl transferase component Bud32
LPLPNVVANCDVIQAIYDGQIAFTAFELSETLNKPFVLSFHGGFDTNAKIWKPHLRELTRTIADRATLVTVVSRMDVERLRQLGVNRTIEILPVSVDFAMLPPLVPSKSRNLLAIGRLVPKKGFDTAIAALSHLPDSFRLRIVGAGPEESMLRALTAKVSVANRVEFTGFLPLRDMLRMMAESCVLLHPARVAEDGNAEGTPQVLLWAQALGIPVVAGDSGSIRDIVEDGISGRIVPPGDSRALAEAVMVLADAGREREQIVARARSMVQERHDLPRVLLHWRSVYKRAASAKRGRGPICESPALQDGHNLRFGAAFAAARSELGSEARFALLYSGSQSVIYLANSPERGTVLVKLANYLSDNWEDALLAEHRILKEGEALTALNRQGCQVVPRLYYLDFEGRFLVREFVEGSSLQDAVPLIPPADRVRLMPSLWAMGASLFRAFHNRPGKSYAVRDLKPRNLVLTRDEKPQLLFIDVGSARPIEQPIGAIRSRSRVRLGTRNWVYWAPEVLVGNGMGATERSDFFSFGATVFYALLGREPFSNAEADPDKAMDAYFAEYPAITAAWMERCEALHVPESCAIFIKQSLHPLRAERPEWMPFYE